MDTSTHYHRPVMLHECLEGLALRPEGTYIDVTFGGGGHTRAILDQLGPQGRVVAFDQDADAQANAQVLANDPRFIFVAANFRHLKRYLRLHRIEQVDGILADLGVSSHQFDTASRGFSTRFEADLDMRMNQQSPLTAQDILNTYSTAELQRILGQYGEVINARTLAEAIFAARHAAPIRTVEELKAIVGRYAPRQREHKYFAQVFQALRIEVNDEMGALEDFLAQAPEVLRAGGRLVVLSYHSLEDRPVKNFINKGKIVGEVEKDFYGNELKPLRAVLRKPQEASPEEIAQNPRARSAKLRVAERTTYS